MPYTGLIKLNFLDGLITDCESYAGFLALNMTRPTPWLVHLLDPPLHAPTVAALLRGVPFLMRSGKEFDPGCPGHEHRRCTGATIVQRPDVRVAMHRVTESGPGYLEDLHLHHAREGL